MSNADLFRSLHAGPDLLILPNAWDAGSARVIETLGAKAVATSSAAVCWSHGYADGHHLPVEFLITTVREITRVISIPLTCDFEGGYADDAATVGENVARVIDAGAVGINIEDGLEPPDLLAAKIEAVRKTVDKAGVALFINARTDVYLKRIAEGGAAVFVSSHVMDEAERCDRLLLMREGVIIADDSPAGIKQASGVDDIEQAFLALVKGAAA